MTDTKTTHTPGPWWERETDDGFEPVVYQTDVQRLKRDASDLLAALKAIIASATTFHIAGTDVHPVVSTARLEEAKAIVAKAERGAA